MSDGTAAEDLDPKGQTGAETGAAGPGEGAPAPDAPLSAAEEFAALGLEPPAVAQVGREPAPVGGCQRCGRARPLVAEKDGLLLCGECGWNADA